MENIDTERMTLYYQVDYTLTDVPNDAAYFHAQFRRSNPLPYKTDHVILDGVKGWGQYVGTYLAYGTHNTGWWGEGEVKFFIDGDSKFPTICGTGTEDYFCGSYDFESGPENARHYTEFTTSLLWALAGDSPGRSLRFPTALQPLSLAHHGSRPLRAGFESNHPGARLAVRRAVPSATGRYLLNRLLVSDRAACTVSEVSR